MAIANFPKNILPKKEGTLVLLFSCNPLPLSEMKLLTLSNIEVYLKEAITIKSNNVLIPYLNSATLPLANGYNSLTLTYQNNKMKFILVNQKGYYVAEANEFAPGGNLKFSDTFNGTYVAMQTNTETLITKTNTELLNLAKNYKTNHFTNILSETTINEIQHPFTEELSRTNDIFYRNFRENNIRYEKKPWLEIPNSPVDDSPILVKVNNKYLTRQYSFDFETAELKSTIKEEFLLDGLLMFELSYENVDTSYPIIIYVEEELLQNYKFENGNLFLYLEEWEHDLFYGKKITVEYYLKDAYFVEYNEDTAEYSYKIKVTNHDNGPIEVIQEGNSSSPVKLATELELNPIVNPQHTGFIYIDKEKQTVKDFRINISSQYLVMDGIDSADIIIEAIDQYGNEVLSPYLDVYLTDRYNSVQTNYGVISPIINYDTMRARNAAGRLYFKYRAPLFKPTTIFKDELFLNVVDRQTKLGSQAVIRLKAPIGNVSTNNSYLKDTPTEASLPFEYFARYYEKTLPAESPLNLFDKNKDKILTYDDWLYFKESISNKILMQSITNDLRKEIIG